jgi:hypothetical protein
MNLLLDTHVLLWWLDANPTLSKLITWRDRAMFREIRSAEEIFPVNKRRLKNVADIHILPKNYSEFFSLLDIYMFYSFI